MLRNLMNITLYCLVFEIDSSFCADSSRYIHLPQISNQTEPFGELSKAGTKLNSGNLTTAYPVSTTLIKPPARRTEKRDGLNIMCGALRSIYQGFSLEEASTANEVTARHKNYYQKSFPIIIIAFMMMLAFVIPMGFQFMVMVGGKALLLSQMALIFGLSGAFKKWNPPEFPTYDLPWQRVAGQPPPNRFDEVALRKSSKFGGGHQTHQEMFQIPYMQL